MLDILGDCRANLVDEIEDLFPIQENLVCQRNDRSVRDKRIQAVNKV